MVIMAGEPLVLTWVKSRRGSADIASSPIGRHKFLGLKVVPAWCVLLNSGGFSMAQFRHDGDKGHAGNLLRPRQIATSGSCYVLFYVSRLPTDNRSSRQVLARNRNSPPPPCHTNISHIHAYGECRFFSIDGLAVSTQTHK